MQQGCSHTCQAQVGTAGFAVLPSTSRLGTELLACVRRIKGCKTSNHTCEVHTCSQEVARTVLLEIPVPSPQGPSKPGHGKPSNIVRSLEMVGL